jgi:hypothetical protein
MKGRGKNLSMHMAAPSTITEIALESLPNEKGDIIKFGSECFDAGVIEILKQIANSSLTTRHFTSTEETQKRAMETEERYLELKNSLNDAYIPLAENLDQAWGDFMAAEAYDYYVSGFIDGYRYLKNYIAHNKGAVKEWIK